MPYLKARIAQYWPEWGDATRYLEIGDDLYATRDVLLYDNGNALRYDRNNWADDTWVISSAKYDAELWLRCWGPDGKFTASEFETAWALAESAPNQPQAYSTDAGPWPMLTAELYRKSRGFD